MRKLTPEGKRLVEDLANRYGVSAEAVSNVLHALIRGRGRLAQFEHPDLGGPGQWMQGGMTMVGDMFNNSLKATVDGLCDELSSVIANQPADLAPSSGQSQSQFQGEGQQQRGPGGLATNGPAVSLFVPPTAGGSAHWWPDDLGTAMLRGARTACATPTSPRRGASLSRSTGGSPSETGN